MLSLMSVATKPGLIALTLIGVSRNSLAKAIMIALSAALDAEYAVRGQRASPLAGSISLESDPIPELIITILPAPDFRTNGRKACVT